MSTSEADAEQEMRRAFAVFDADKSGTITEEELTAILTRRVGGGHTFTVEEAERRFRQVDLNGDGVVDYGEFCKSWSMIRSGGGANLADLQHPDAEHLLVGINLEGLRRHASWSASRTSATRMV